MTSEVEKNDVIRGLLQQYTAFFCDGITRGIQQAVYRSNFSKKYSLKNLWPEKVLLFGFLHGVETGDLGLAGIATPKLEAELVADLSLWLPLEYCSSPGTLEQLATTAKRARDSALLEAPAITQLLNDIINLSKHPYRGLSNQEVISSDEVKELTVYHETIAIFEKVLAEKIIKAFESINQRSRFSLKFILQTLWPSKALFLLLLYGLISHDITLCTPAISLFLQTQDQDDLEYSDLRQSILYEFSFSQEDINKANAYFFLYRRYNKNEIPNDLVNLITAVLENPLQQQGMKSTLCPKATKISNSEFISSRVSSTTGSALASEDLDLVTSTTISKKKISRNALEFEKDNFVVLLDNKLASASTAPKQAEDDDTIEISDDEIDSKENLHRTLVRNMILNKFNQALKSLVLEKKIDGIIEDILHQPTKQTSLSVPSHQEISINSKAVPRKDKDSSPPKHSPEVKRKIEKAVPRKDKDSSPPKHSPEVKRKIEEQQAEDMKIDKPVRKLGRPPKKLQVCPMKDNSSPQSASPVVAGPSVLGKRRYRKMAGATAEDKVSEVCSMKDNSSPQSASPVVTGPSVLGKRKYRKMAGATAEDKVSEVCSMKDNSSPQSASPVVAGPSVLGKRKYRKMAGATAEDKVSEVCSMKDNSSPQSASPVVAGPSVLGRRKYRKMAGVTAEDKVSEKVSPVKKSRGKPGSKKQKRGKQGAKAQEETDEVDKAVKKASYGPGRKGPIERRKKKTEPELVALEEIPLSIRISARTKIAAVNEREMRYTLLHYAVLSGMPKALKKVLQDGTTAVDRTDAQGESALHLAIRSRQDFNLIRTLVELGGADVNLPTLAGHTPLHLACMRPGTLFLVKYLIKHGADPNMRDNQGKTPEELCILKGKKNPALTYLRQLKH